MTVKELIKTLRNLDQNKTVVVRTAYYDNCGDDGLDRFYNDYEIDEEDVYEDDDTVYLGEY